MDNKEKIKQLEDQMKIFQSQIDELKKQPASFEVGKWYWRPHINALGQFNKLGSFNIGWIEGGEFTTTLHMNDFSVWELASPQTIEEFFIKEAKKRGFKEGIRIDKSCFIEEARHNISIGSKNDCEIHYDTFKIVGGDDVVLHLDHNSIYHNGKWARIIPTQPLKIAGYDIQVTTDDGIKVGCKSICRTEFQWMGKFMAKNGFKSIKFDGHKDVTLEEINKLLEKTKV